MSPSSHPALPLQIMADKKTWHYIFKETGMMRKWILPLLGLLMTLTAAAQNAQLAEIAAHLETNRISLNYDCTFTQDAPIQLTGVLLIQGTCYQAKGNGMEIYCDGQTRWTVDPKAREVYIEKAEGLEELMVWGDSLSDLKISGIQYLPLSEDLKPFRFETAGLDAEWVVTDLR